MNVQNKKVVDVHGNRDVEGQNVIVWNRHNGANQRWKIIYVDSVNDKPGKGLNRDFGFYGNRPFYIRSKLPMQRFVEVVGGRNVVLKTFAKNRRAQQFIFDAKSKTIKSYQWRDRSLDIQNSGKSSNLQVWKTNARWFQLFRYQGNYLINEKGKVMDVHGNKDQENRNIIVWNKHRGLNQQWDIIYADDMEDEPKKGQLNKEFGLYVERDFHIVSQMPGRRYVDVFNGRNVQLKTSNGQKSQVWYFDQRSKTIKNRKTNKSFDIQNSGRNRNLQVWSTNSGWWQIFKYVSYNFVNVKNKHVLDVSGNRDVEGQNIITYRRHNGLNQRWVILHLDEKKAEPTSGLDDDFGFYRNRPFYIVSRLPKRRVVEVVGGRNLQIKTKNRKRQSQLFYFDHLTKTIKSKQYTGKSFDIQSAGKSNNLQVWTTNSRWFQLFEYQNGNLVNSRGKVMDVHGGRDQEGRNIIVWRKHNGKNQQWDIQYADEPDKKSGFQANRPFNIVSQLRGKRLLTMKGNNFVIQRRNNSIQQMFIYDASSRTVKPYSSQGKSMGIQSHGRSRNIGAYNTNGGWYQRWDINGAFFTNEKGKVMDVTGSGDRDGQNVIAWRKHGGKNQQWSIQYVNSDSIKGGLIPDKPFKILSKLRSGRAVTREGKNIVIRDKSGNNQNQLFVFDSRSGSIQPRNNRSVSLDIGDSGRGRYMTVQRTQNIWDQHFNLDGDRIVNERGLVFDVSGGRDRNGQNVLVWKKHNGLNQKWKVDYV